MKHTPAPWKIETERHNYFVVASGKTIAEIFSPFGNGSHDARLIAAAPELFEALEKLLQRSYQFTDEGPLLDGWKSDEFESEIKAAESALRKAKGKTP